MSKSYSPGLKILGNTHLTRLRQLPLKGEVHLNVGDEVQFDTIVASTKIPGNVQMLNIANQLNVEPESVPECMLVELDEPISKGQLLAESKGLFGLFKSQVKSPIEGTLANVSNITGQAILSEPPIPIEVNAYTSGKVKEVIPEEGVTIETNCVLIQGILGLGGENSGEIVSLVQSPSETTSADMINESHIGKILICGAYISLETFKKAQSLKVAGIVIGGFGYNDLSKILGYSLGVAITGSENLGTSIMITEGFGNISIAKRTFDLLTQHIGHFGSINGSTQIRAGVIRPEILIPLEKSETSSVEFNEDDLIISEGSPVRVVRDPYFGEVGKVVALPPELTKMESETMVRVAEVKFPNGEVKIIPRANLEMILSDK